MNANESGGRVNQKARTRQAIVHAAGVLLSRGERPGLDDIAAEARVSRATAYRYFPGLDALLSEAAVDLLVPAPAELLGPGAPADPFARLAMVDATFDRACRDREIPLRLMLARMLERSVAPGQEDAPLRQNRRTPMIEAALAPLKGQVPQASLDRLTDALAVMIGTEALIALKDVVGLDEKEAREVRLWAIEALLAKAIRDAA